MTAEERAEQFIDRPIVEIEKVEQRAHERHFSPGRVYQHHFGEDPRRERIFLSTLGFFGGFAVTRTVTHMIKHDIGPFHNLETKGGRHLHHLVFGIGGLLTTGYLWLLQYGTHHDDEHNTKVSRTTAVAYGAAAALTLDEFALWLNLQDVYWAPEGRASIDAVYTFGGLLSLGMWGGPFLRAMVKEFRKLF